MCKAHSKVTHIKQQKYFLIGDYPPRVARFLAAKYGRLLFIRDVRQGQYDAISCVGLPMCLFVQVYSNYGRICSRL